MQTTQVLARKKLRKLYYIHYSKKCGSKIFLRMYKSRSSLKT